jgi:integrase/recombinase XerD
MNTFNKCITLKHLLIAGKKQIGLQFYPDKVIQALLKELPGIKWNQEFGMAYVANNKINLNLIYQKFRGVAWINSNYFFSKRRLNNENEEIDVNWFRKRTLPIGYRTAPEAFLLKLELKRYANNTAKTYINCFEKFLNAQTEQDLRRINEQDIQAYLQNLIQEKKSNSYVNQMINSIKLKDQGKSMFYQGFYQKKKSSKSYRLLKTLSTNACWVYYTPLEFDWENC